MNNAIEITGLIKTYEGGTQALKGINLTVEEGGFFALLGANGAGKTTTIGILTGLVNKTSGSVKVFGYDLDTQLNDVKRYIGVVPQEFNFNMFEKVLDIVVNQAGYYGIPYKEALPRAHAILDKLGLKDKKNVMSRTLSGGMKRRLMIARSLIHMPKLLILDEPTAGVDVELRVGMWEYLKELNEKEGVTILLTTHYLEEVEQLCKRAAIIRSGEIVSNDTVKNLLLSLEQETYVIESKNIPANLSSSRFTINVIDDSTIEVILKKSDSINDLVAELSSKKVTVLGIRPKGNRLEELFLNIIK